MNEAWITLFVIGGGIFSTMAMTLFTIIAFSALQRPYNVLRILGHMLLFEPFTAIRQPPPKPAKTLAIFVHYGIGIVFAWGFQHFVVHDARAELLRSLLYGVAIALLAVSGWRFFFFLHPGPPNISLPLYLLVIAAGHLVLTGCLYALYNILQTL